MGYLISFVLLALVALCRAADPVPDQLDGVWVATGSHKFIDNKGTYACLDKAVTWQQTWFINGGVAIAWEATQNQSPWPIESSLTFGSTAALKVAGNDTCVASTLGFAGDGQQVRVVAVSYNLWGELDTVKIISGVNNATCPAAAAVTSCTPDGDTPYSTSVLVTLKRATHDKTQACTAYCNIYVGLLVLDEQSDADDATACITKCQTYAATGVFPSTFPAKALVGAGPTSDDVQCRLAQALDIAVKVKNTATGADPAPPKGDGNRFATLSDSQRTALIATLPTNANSSCNATWVSRVGDCSVYCGLAVQNCPAQGPLPAAAGWGAIGAGLKPSLSAYDACYSFCSSTALTGNFRINLFNGTASDVTGNTVQCRSNMLATGSFLDVPTTCAVAGAMSATCRDNRDFFTFADPYTPSPTAWKPATKCDPSCCCLTGATVYPSNLTTPTDRSQLLWNIPFGGGSKCYGQAGFGGYSTTDFTKVPAGTAYIDLNSQFAGLYANFTFSSVAHLQFVATASLIACPTYMCANTSDPIGCPAAFSNDLKGINTNATFPNVTSSSSTGSSSSSSSSSGIIVPSAAAHTGQSLLSAAFALAGLLVARVYLA